MKTKLFSFSLLLSIAMIFASCDKTNNNGNNNEPDAPETNNVLKGTIEGTMTLDASIQYFLEGGLNVPAGSVLAIPAGTKIVARSSSSTGTAGYIIVEQGGKIIAEGTREKPIIMTCEDEKIGAWGGLHICGKAPINVEGGKSSSEIGDKIYGGTDVNDNSGVLRYVVLMYGGHQITSEKEHNGFTLYGVGNGTTLEYLQAYKCADDAFEWFGGTVNAKYLVATECGDDLFDWTYGWSGNAQFLFGIYGQETSSDDPRGIEADGNDKNNALTPYSNPTLSNITLVGFPNNKNINQGVMLRRGTKVHLANMLIKDFGINSEKDKKKGGIEIRDKVTTDHINNGDFKLEAIVIHTNTSGIIYGKGAEGVKDQKALESGISFKDFTLNGMVGTLPGGVDLSKKDKWFTSTDFIGAVDAKNDWTKGWTVK